jgi:ubiquinone/menaquinone biosynthesis C-methylase UbiE
MEMRRLEKRFVNSQAHSARVATRAEQFVRMTDPRSGQRLLDVGCGNGAAALHLATTFRLSVIGVDIDPAQIATATTSAGPLPRVSFITADAAALPFADGEFDLVYSNKTTHHIHDWQRAFSEMLRVLKPGGYLIYSDFVAPIGRTLPTRSTINRLADHHGLQPILTTSSPFRYTTILRSHSQPSNTSTEAVTPHAY